MTNSNNPPTKPVANDTRRARLSHARQVETIVEQMEMDDARSARLEAQREQNRILRDELAKAREQLAQAYNALAIERASRQQFQDELYRVRGELAQAQLELSQVRAVKETWADEAGRAWQQLEESGFFEAEAVPA